MHPSPFRFDGHHHHVVPHELGLHVGRGHGLPVAGGRTSLSKTCGALGLRAWMNWARFQRVKSRRTTRCRVRNTPFSVSMRNDA